MSESLTVRQREVLDFLREFIECEIFAEAYRRWGLATVRWPVVEVRATVSMFENGNGLTLNVHGVRKPRIIAGGGA